MLPVGYFPAPGRKLGSLVLTNEPHFITFNQNHDISSTVTCRLEQSIWVTALVYSDNYINLKLPSAGSPHGGPRFCIQP